MDAIEGAVEQRVDADERHADAEELQGDGHHLRFLGRDLAVLIDEPHRRESQDREECGEREGREEDLTKTDGKIVAELLHAVRGRVPREGGEQDGPHGDGEHTLRKLEQTEGFVDVGHGALVREQAGELSIHKGVEVDDAQTDHDRPEDGGHL